MRRNAGNFLMLLGTVLIAMALSLFLYNRWESNRAGEASEQILEEMKTAEAGEQRDALLYPEEEEEIPEMTVVNIDGYDYIGYVTIPSLDRTLPVMSEWSYPGLKIAPGRYSGSVYTDDLVIAGHNYARHFSPIKWLTAGTKIDFTDMENVVWHYEVVSVETLKPMQVEEMTGKTAGDDWDLTLFTCNTGGATRCAVRCARVR